ncbi:MAG: hypothetical protein FK732_09655 [Asgard group archaeon]|nr:hypothetical protein [Asgard group archaeon]
MDTEKMNEIDEDLEPERLKIVELGEGENLRPTEVYYIIEHWLIICNFLDREDFVLGNGECLGIGHSFVVTVHGNGQPSSIEFLDGQERWEIKKSFKIPDEYVRGKVFLIFLWIVGILIHLLNVI